ncbi:hypothetical protein EVAR_77368_1 [Eumeta japonica]|uniref:Uncharacterized protein n=1 Tax=Eumeta variegata TaxID=151549 RepID=A0A4C1UX44_EUMVA|nr:hypothetical protein EVAR_77368_1 [Eumeta japonica]
MLIIGFRSQYYKDMQYKRQKYLLSNYLVVFVFGDIDDVIGGAFKWLPPLRRKLPLAQFRLLFVHPQAEPHPVLPNKKSFSTNLQKTRSVRHKRRLRLVVTIAGLQSTRATIVVRATSYLAEDDSENEVFGDQPSSNEEEDHLEESDHQSESEQDGELPGETSVDNSEPEEPP